MVKSLRIAFVSSRPSIRRFREEGSFIYRCENLALTLSGMGHKVNLLHITALLFKRNFDVVVFLRPSGGRLYDYLTKRLRARGAVLIGDVDDLIFDPNFAQYKPSVKNQTADEGKSRAKYIKVGSALSKLDRIVVSTEALAKHYQALHPSTKCIVIPNASHGNWLAIPPSHTVKEKTISYFSGTRTHDRDFAIVAPVLRRLLERHSDLKIRIVGPLADELDHPRVIRMPKVAFEEYAKLVQDSYVCIAPLEDTPFNQCKSALKALESGVMNIPIVVSPIGDFLKVNVKGVLHARTPEDWTRQLEYALESVNYKELSDGLRERTLAFADIKKFAIEFLNFVEH